MNAHRIILGHEVKAHNDFGVKLGLPAVNGRVRMMRDYHHRFAFVREDRPCGFIHQTQQIRRRP